MIAYANSDNSMRFTANATERARIDSSGRVLAGTTSSSGNFRAVFQGNAGNSAAGGDLLLARGSATPSNAQALGLVGFSDNTHTISAQIQCNRDGGTWSSSSKPTLMAFQTCANGSSTPTERMRINSTGDVTIAKSTTSINTDGILLGSGGLLTATRSNSYTSIFNRGADDGQVIVIAQGNTHEGSISVSGSTVNYNQFLGSHWAALTDWSRPEIKIGTILETINELTDWKYAAIEVEGEQKKICYNGTAAPGDTASVEYEGEIYEGIVELETDPDFNKAVKVKVNDTAASKAVYGVFVAWNTDSDLDGGIWNDMYVGAVGNYVIRMAAGQDPEIGDLVESNGTGCGVVQDDDIIRTKTVAKITNTIPQVTYDDGSFLVTCVLYCG